MSIKKLKGSESINLKLVSQSQDLALRLEALIWQINSSDPEWIF